MKFRKDLIDIMETYTVQCHTKKQAEILLNELVKYGVRWEDDLCIVYDTKWDIFQHDSCYRLVQMEPPELALDDYETCMEFGDEFIEFEELLVEQVNDNNGYDDLATKVEDLLNNLVACVEDKAEAYKDGYVRACEDLREEF